MLLCNWYIGADMEASLYLLDIRSQFLWDLSTPEEEGTMLI
jgi:hypothetical protein